MNIMNVKQRTLELFKQSAAPGFPISLGKARENKARLLVGLLMAVIVLVRSNLGAGEK